MVTKNWSELRGEIIRRKETYRKIGYRWFDFVKKGHFSGHSKLKIIGWKLKYYSFLNAAYQVLLFF